MKRTNILLIVFIQLSISLCFGNSKKATDKQSFVRVSKENPEYLELSNGSSYIPVGPNICFPRLITDEEKGFENIEMMYKNLAKYGANYTRIFLGAEFFEIENKKQGMYDESKLKRLDRLVKLAEKYNIRIRFCFEHFRFLKENVERFKGSLTFQKPIYSVENGGDFTTTNEYFTTEKGKSVYMNRVSTIVNRYKNNPNVFGWELWNEFNAVDISGKNQSLINWTAEILDRIHKLDSNHLVMQSLGSFDTESVRSIYRSIDSLPANDVAITHRYIDLGAKLAVCHGPMDIMAADATRELLKFGFKKPVLVGEAGAVEPNHIAPSKLYVKDTSGILLHDILFAPFFAGSAGTGQSWHWKEYLELNNLWYHFGRFNEAIKDINPLNENFNPAEFEIPDCRCYALDGKLNTIIWCRDSKSNWKTELVDNTKPSVLKCALPLSKLNITPEKIKSIRIYDPWKNSWVKAKVSNGIIKLPPFTRSLIVRIGKN